jgi:hypothetical protein
VEEPAGDRCQARGEVALPDGSAPARGEVALPDGSAPARLTPQRYKVFAHGGEHTEENLTLRCRAHNDLAAEKDFGRDYIELARDSTEHEPWATHEAARCDARAALR